VACSSGVDVKTTPDERGVGVIVDATVVQSKKNMIIAVNFPIYATGKKKPTSAVHI